jgi:hypothetical protein
VFRKINGSLSISDSGFWILWIFIPHFDDCAVVLVFLNRTDGCCLTVGNVVFVVLHVNVFFLDLLIFHLFARVYCNIVSAFMHKNLCLWILIGLFLIWICLSVIVFYKLLF